MLSHIMDLQLGYVECSQLSHEMMWTDTELMNLIKKIPNISEL